MTDEEKIKEAKNFVRRTDGAAQISLIILQVLIEIKEILKKKK